MLEVLASMHQRGMYFEFENGLRVSVQMGMGTYSDSGRSNMRFITEELSKQDKSVKSENAEVAVFYKNEWVTALCPFLATGGDEVAGWVSADEVVNVMFWAKNLTQTEKMTFCVERYRRDLDDPMRNF